MVQIKRVCQWELASGGTCTLKTTGGTDFCYLHLPLAKIEYKRPKPKTKFRKTLDAVEDLRTKWKLELDSDFEAARDRDEDERQESRRSRKDEFWQPDHFPYTNRDGIRFKDIDDFYLFYAGQGFSEMVGSDQEYLRDEVLPPLPKSRQGIMFPEFDRGSGFSSNRNYDYHSFSNYRSKPKPRKHLKRGEWERIEKIEHMRYVVLRHPDGHYYCAWISLDKPGHLKDVMGFMMKQTLPQGVTECEWGRYHTSKPQTTFEAADGKLTTVGESFWRIRDRIKKARDPNWIPPNLRALAVKNQFDAIPLKWRDRLHQWREAGAPGWKGGKGIIDLIDTAEGKVRTKKQ
jgi:hypothetical protein